MARAVLLASLLLICAGCATGTTYRVGVSGLAAPQQPEGKTYVLLLTDPKIAKDLLTTELGAYAEVALLGRGYRRIMDIEKADLAIFFEFGKGDPITSTYTYSTPVWGQTGVSSSRTTGTASTFGGTTTYSGTTTYTPDYGIVGYTSHTGTSVSQTSWFRLSAWDLAEKRRGGEPRMLWRTLAANADSQGDLRQDIPVMMAAAFPYLARSSGKDVSVTISENDESVIRLRNIVHSPTPPSQPAPKK